MAVQFHKLTVAEVRRETPDAIAITFTVPHELLPVFQYKTGQYLTVRMEVDGVSHRRNYSLCSSPFFDEPLTIAVKRVNDGVVSSWLNEGVKAGDVIEVYPPMGNFTKELSAQHAKHYVLFGGGSGITPLMSILKSILRVEPNSKVTLFYANRDRASVIFGEQLRSIEQANDCALTVVHVLESPGILEATGVAEAQQGALNTAAVITGVMDRSTVEGLLQKIERNSDTEYFVCGPQGMMDSVMSVLKDKGIDDKHIHREYFTLEKTAMETPPVVDEVKTHSVTIKLYGKQHTFDVQPDETILSAAQRENLDPPYACQIGACCTCRARILSGKVVMDEREALSDDEIAEGYVLTCQSHPVTAGVVADYDQ